MKLKVTNPMTNLINNYFRSIGSDYRATLEKLTPEEFTRIVDYKFFDHFEDYDTNKQIYKAIRISYPAGYYAIDKYITTNELTKAFRESDKTAAGFLKSLYKIIEI